MRRIWCVLADLKMEEACNEVYAWASKTNRSPHVWLFATLWTAAYQAPPSLGFSRQEYWSGLPFPSPGYLPDPRIEPGSPKLEADALTSEPPRKPPWLTASSKRESSVWKPLEFNLTNILNEGESGLTLISAMWDHNRESSFILPWLLLYRTMR